MKSPFQTQGFNFPRSLYVSNQCIPLEDSDQSHILTPAENLEKVLQSHMVDDTFMPEVNVTQVLDDWRDN